VLWLKYKFRPARKLETSRVNKNGGKVMKYQGSIWREITIPPHKGTEDLLALVEKSGMHVEHWAKGVVLARPFPARTKPQNFRVARIPASGSTDRKFIWICETKAVGRHYGLRFLNAEKVLALRLAYSDQPIEWMRVAVKTFVDKDHSHLDLALVNDGSRKDIRTTWAFPGNQFQAEHEWFWEIP
jgi:hypothetical protein